MKKIIIRSLLILIVSLIISYVISLSLDYNLSSVSFVMAIVLLIIGFFTLYYDPNILRSSRGINPGSGHNVDLQFQQLEKENTTRKIGKLSSFNIMFIIPAIIMFILCMAFVEKPKDIVTSYKLSNSQKDLLNMISPPNGIYELFYFNTKSDFKKFTSWVDIYKNGELVEKELSKIEMLNDENKPMKGNLAVSLIKSSNYFWNFVLNSGQAKTNTNGVTNVNFDNLNHINIPLTSSKVIENDKEIVLYRIVYNSSSGFSAYSNEYFDSNSDAIKEFDYVQVIKCKFTK